jgi:hypothetical protein
MGAPATANLIRRILRGMKAFLRSPTLLAVEVSSSDAGASRQDERCAFPMDTGIAQSPQDALPLEQQVARLQALLEATRQVHSTIQVNEVLLQSARILVRDWKWKARYFLAPSRPRRW